MAGMRLRQLMVTAALVAGTSVGAASPAAAVTTPPGEWKSPPGPSSRTVTVTGSLAVVDPAGTVAVLVIDVGRRHAQQRPLTILATSQTVVTRRGRPASFMALNSATVTVTGTRSGDRVAATRVAG